MPLNPYLADDVVIAKVKSIVRRVADTRKEDHNEYINQAIATCHTTIRNWEPGKGKSFYDYIKRHVWRSALNHYKRGVRATPGGILAVLNACGSSQQGSEPVRDGEGVREIMEGLTEREAEVVGLYARGLSHAEIGRALGISRQVSHQTLARVRRRKTQTQ